MLAPAGVNPYALIGYRDQLRFSAFDPAEAAGRDAAWLYAALVDEGDMMRIEMPPMSGIAEIREVTSVETAGAQVWITTAGLGGDTSTRTYPSRDRVEVMFPARHPAEDGPYAGRLFAPRPYQAQPGPADSPDLTGIQAPSADRTAGAGSDRLTELEDRIASLEREVARLRGDGTAAGTGGWQASLSIGEALGRRRPDPAAPADPHGWGETAGSTGPLLDAQAGARQAIPELRASGSGGGSPRSPATSAAWPATRTRGGCGSPIRPGRCGPGGACGREPARSPATSPPR